VSRLLEVDAVTTFYGESHILFDLSLHVEGGEVVALLGRNGSGKTTTMNTIMGIVPPRSGRVRVAGEDVTGLRPHAIAQRSVHAPHQHGSGALRRRAADARDRPRADPRRAPAAAR
jgi:ABC-type branched-subunit amino acid transport system ATPase component